MNLQKKIHNPTQQSVAWWRHPLPPKNRETFNKSNLRIGCITSKKLYDGLKYEANIFTITPENYIEVLKYGLLDFILIESCMKSASNHWIFAQLKKSEENDILLDVLNKASKSNIPIVYWNTFDSSYYHLFKDFSKNFDLVYSADIENIHNYFRDNVRSLLLQPAIQPIDSNPFVDLKQQNFLNNNIIFDGWGDLLLDNSNHKLIKSHLDLGLGIIESQNLIFYTRKYENNYYQQNILGCIHPEFRSHIIKNALINITSGTTRKSTTSQQWLSLEASGCRTLCIHDSQLGIDDTRKDTSLQFSTINEFVASTREFLKKPHTRDKYAHLFWRNTHNHHTYFHRLKKICKDLCINFDAEEHPLVTVITPTFRKNLIGKCIDQFKNQTYPNKELIILYNNSENIDFNNFSNAQNVSFFYIPNEYSAGCCMNIGATLGRGEFCFRMDDDDEYGPNYLLDSILHHKSTNADIFGKPPSFVSLENSSTIYKRKQSAYALKTITSEDIFESDNAIRLSGNTISGKREVFLSTQYPDKSIGAADTFFLFSLYGRKLHVAILDSLNMRILRNKNNNSHTWKISFRDLVSESNLFDGSISDIII